MDEHKFAESLNEPTAHRAWQVAQRANIHTEAAQELVTLLERLAETKEPNWAHEMLNQFVDPFIILFGEGGLQLCTNELKRLDIFQHLCKNWLPIMRDVAQFGKHSELYEQLNQQRPERRKSFESLDVDLRMNAERNFEDQSWDWIEAFLPLYLSHRTLADMRSSIFSSSERAVDKPRKIRNIRLLTQHLPIQWEELEFIHDDPELLQSLVEEKGGWNEVPKAVVEGVMKRSVYCCKPQTVELLLDMRPDLKFERVKSTFLDFETSEIFDDPIADRLIEHWNITPEQLHRNFDWMEGDYEHYPAIPRLLQRYPI